MKLRDKIIVVSIVLGGLFGVYNGNKKTIHKNVYLHRLNTDLKDVYSQSKYYEKMSRHGLSIPEEKWEELHEKANDIKAEIQFIKNNY